MNQFTLFALQLPLIAPNMVQGRQAQGERLWPLNWHRLQLFHRLAQRLDESRKARVAFAFKPGVVVGNGFEQLACGVLLVAEKARIYHRQTQQRGFKRPHYGLYRLEQMPVLGHGLNHHGHHFQPQHLADATRLLSQYIVQLSAVQRCQFGRPQRLGKHFVAGCHRHATRCTTRSPVSHCTSAPGFAGVAASRRAAPRQARERTVNLAHLLQGHQRRWHSVVEPRGHVV